MKSLKITERLALLKAGYSKEDIASMLEEEKQAQEVKPEETTEDTRATYEEVLVSLANEVKSLKETMQATNRNNVDTIASVNKVDEAKKILEGLINPLNDNKEE